MFFLHIIAYQSVSFCEVLCDRLVTVFSLIILELFTLCSNGRAMKMGTDSSQKLNNEYLIYPVMSNEVKMHDINEREMTMVLLCGSIMVM